MKNKKKLIAIGLISIFICTIIFLGTWANKKTWVEIDLPAGLGYEYYANFYSQIDNNIKIYDINIAPIGGFANASLMENNEILQIRYNSIDYNNQISIELENLQDGSTKSKNIQLGETLHNFESDDLNIWGMNLIPHATKSKILVSNLNKHLILNKKTIKEFHITWHNPITGEINREIIKYKNFNELKDKLEKTQEEVNKLIERDKELFLKENPDFIKTVAEITKNSSSEHEKAQQIFAWITQNIEPLENLTDAEKREKLNVNWLWVNKKGQCRSSSYVYKLMLEIEGIESKIFTVLSTDISPDKGKGQVYSTSEMEEIIPHMMVAVKIDDEFRFIESELLSFKFYIPKTITLSELYQSLK